MRPTVAAIVRIRIDREFKFLVVDSVNGKSGQNPGIPKGGVHVAERAIEALYRELEEELGMHVSCLKLVAYLGADIVASASRHRGVDQKCYFTFLVEYSGNETLRVSKREIRNYRWLTYGELTEALEILNPIRRAKFNVLKKLFARAYEESLSVLEAGTSTGRPTCL